MKKLLKHYRVSIFQLTLQVKTVCSNCSRKRATRLNRCMVLIDRDFNIEQLNAMMRYFTYPKEIHHGTS